MLNIWNSKLIKDCIKGREYDEDRHKLSLDIIC